MSIESDLSISFLSQVERGITSIAVTSLEKIASVFEVDLSYFFSPPSKHDSLIIRSYEQEVFSLEETRVYKRLASDTEDKILEPMLITLFPQDSKHNVATYAHEGEEFAYVLEGILTIQVNEKQYQLNPGDSLHLSSNTPHEWANFTNKLVKVLCVSTPKIF